MLLSFLMMLSNIIDVRYDVDIQRFYHLKQSKRRRIQVVLPIVTSETLRLKFWYQAPYRASLLGNFIIKDSTSIKNKLGTLLARKFNSIFNEDIICTWSFICLGDTYRMTVANFNSREKSSCQKMEIHHI